MKSTMDRFGRGVVPKPMRTRPGLHAGDRETVRRLGDLGLSGGIVYDALACCAAVRAKVDLILTFNTKNSRRAWPEIGARVEEP